MTGEMTFCLSFGKIEKAAANTVGIMPPPMKPWSARQTIISSIEVAVEQRMLISVKPAAEITNR